MPKHTPSLQRALDLERYVRNLSKRTHKKWYIAQLYTCYGGLHRGTLIAIDGELRPIYWIHSNPDRTY